MIKAIKFEGLQHVVCQCDKCKAEKQEQDGSLINEGTKTKQEPVAYMYPDDLKEFETREMSAHAYSLEMVSPTQGETVALYTHPQPKREWVDLDIKEVNPLCEKYKDQPYKLYVEIRNLLKEKNA
jgi:hypothetical protein